MAHHPTISFLIRGTGVAGWLLLAAAMPWPVAAERDASGRSSDQAQTDALPSSHQPGLLVEVIPVEPVNSIALEQVFVGRVEARQRSELGFERGGRLTELMVREGDTVAAGAVLARLDKSLLQAARAERLAELATAKAELALAEATSGRYQDSVADGAVTRQAFDEAREGATAAAARVQLAQARIDAVDLDLTKTELRAPYAGTVIARLADAGRVVDAGTPILVLQENSAPEIRIGVAGPLVEELVPGAHYPLRLGERTLTARLRALLPVRLAPSLTVDALFELVMDHRPSPDSSPDSSLNSSADVPGHSSATGTLMPAGADPTRARVIGWQSALKPGTPVELNLTKWVEEDGFWLPVSALSEGERGLWRALVAAPLETVATTNDGRHEEAAQKSASPAHATLVARPLQMLHPGLDCAFVRGPLSRGDWVLASGTQRVVPDQPVRTHAITSPCAKLHPRPAASSADARLVPRP